MPVEESQQELAALKQRNCELEKQLEELTCINATLMAVLNTLPQRIFWKDCDLRYLGCNRLFAQDAGVTSSEQLIGKHDQELFWKEVVPLDAVKDVEVIENSIAKINHEAAHIREDGTTLWLRTSKLPLHNQSGAVIGIVGCYEDISDRKQAEEHLRQSEQRFRDVSEAAGEYLWEIDTNGIYLFVTDKAELVKGHSPSELVGHSLFEVMPVEDIEYVQAVLQDALARKSSFRLQHRDVTSSGEIVWEEINGIPLLDQFGQMIGFRGAGLSITERKQTEEALLQEQDFTHVVVENVSDGVVACDANGILKLFNRAAREWHGCDPRFVPSEEWANLYDLYEADGITPLQTERIPLLRAFKGESVREVGMAIAAKGQSPRYILASGDPLFDAIGQKIGAVVAMHDITERKQTEEALQQSEAQLRQQAQHLENALQELQRTQSQLIQSEKMSSLGQLVAGVAHEINNPVSFIYGNLPHIGRYAYGLLDLISLYQQCYPTPAPMIRDTAAAIDLEFLVQDLPKLLESMRVGAERIQAIVTSLRIFSRMDEAEFKAVDLHEGIDSTLMILQNRLRAKPDCSTVQVIKHYGDLPLVECSAGQLNQVFMNILSNAIDALEESFRYTNSTAPTIQICTALTKGDRVLIQISDNGPGMPEPIRRRLFDPFFTTKPVGKGTGMGLSISYQIVTERHGGSLHCISAPGQGAEFVIEIPIRH